MAEAKTTAVVGDVHLDVAGLAKLLQGELAGAEQVVLAGDVVDRGLGEPLDAIRLATSARVTWLIGNHELAYLGGPVYENMREPAGKLLAPRLRELAAEGRLRAAAAVDGVLVVHGGVSGAFWREHLEPRFGADVELIAAAMNESLVRAVATGDFSSPLYASLRDRVRGPYWASLERDVLAGELPPFAQAVGHSKVDEVGWRTCPAGGSGRVLATCLDEAARSVPGWAWM